VKNAFTLLELLVVIAIVSLLAALIFPVFARVKRDARRTQCISNLGQLGLAVQLYQEDANGFLPVGEVISWQNTMGDGSKTRVQSTRDMIKPLLRYVRDSEALTCPENDGFFLPRWVQSFSPALDESRLMVPSSGTVLAQCIHHLDLGWRGGPGFEQFTSFPAKNRQGFHLVLHADGSVGKVNAHDVIQLAFRSIHGLDVWTPATGRDGPHIYDVFPEEHWPPEWIKLPENPSINWGRGS